MSLTRTYIVSKKEQNKTLVVLYQLLQQGVSIDSIVCMAPNTDENLDLETVFKVYDPYLYRGSVPPISPVSTSMKDIFTVLNYFLIFKNSELQNLEDSEIILILEPDVVLHKEFSALLKPILSNPGWNIMSLSKEIPGAVLFRMNFVRRILKTILPFREPIHSELRFQAFFHKEEIFVAPILLAAKRSD